MKIRSITCFANYEPTSGTNDLRDLGEGTKECAKALMPLGYEIQSLRYASQPFATYLNTSGATKAIEMSLELEQRAIAAGFLYASIGPATSEDGKAMEIIPPILAASDSLFATGQITTSKRALMMEAVKRCANVIINNSHASAGGFTNLRFAVLANVGAHVPFFPAAYHDGGAPAIGLAMECADIILKGLSTAGSLQSAREFILAIFNQAAQNISDTLMPLCQSHGFRWLGFDFSPAPYPIEWCSLGKAIERLGGQIGHHGALAGAGWIADLLDSGEWQRTGFNGLMLPVLEDSLLAQRTMDGQLSSKDLLLYSTVCGTGLDTVPLPGDVSGEEIAALLADLGTLSLRLEKPLTARLMPIPGTVTGDSTHFDFAYFANGHVMRLDGNLSDGMLAHAGEIPFTARQANKNRQSANGLA